MKLPSREFKNFDTLGEFLKFKRKQSKLTQEQVGKELGVHLMFVSRFELNKCDVPKKHLKKLIKLYNIDPKNLLKIYLRQEEERLKKFLI